MQTHLSFSSLLHHFGNSFHVSPHIVTLRPCVVYNPVRPCTYSLGVHSPQSKQPVKPSDIHYPHNTHVTEERHFLGRSQANDRLIKRTAKYCPYQPTSPNHNAATSLQYDAPNYNTANPLQIMITRTAITGNSKISLQCRLQENITKWSIPYNICNPQLTAGTQHTQYARILAH